MVTRKNPSKKVVELQVNGRPATFEGELVTGADFLGKEVRIYSSGERFVLLFRGLDLNGNKFDLLEEEPANKGAVYVKLCMLMSSDTAAKGNAKAAANALETIKKGLGIK